jgi:hypothetical protein
VVERSTPDLDAGLEQHALLAQLLEPAVDDPLLELEVGNPVAQQAADAVALLEDRDGVAGARELLRGGEARRTRADHATDARCGAPGGSARSSLLPPRRMISTRSA